MRKEEGMQKYCTMCEANGSSTLETRCGDKTVRACMWQEVCEWREMCIAAKETCMWLEVCKWHEIRAVAKETCVWQEVCKWHEMCAVAKGDCKVMRVCEKHAFVEKDNMNKIEMKILKGQMKEPEPHKLCEPEQDPKVWREYDAMLSRSSEPKELCSQTEERNRNQRLINNPPAVPIFHPTHCNNTHQNRPNSGSEGEEHPAMERGRSKVGPVSKET
eukprot:13308977-Ditylum_brightwellii.AAC.1